MGAEIARLNTEMQAAVEAIGRLHAESQSIAVVADEVRSLAERTQASTEKIRDKIESLQRETDSVSSCIGSADKSVSAGVETCDTNAKMFEQIVDILHDLNEMHIQIAAATEEQQAVTNDISNSITSISDSSSEVSQQVIDVDNVLRICPLSQSN